MGLQSYSDLRHRCSVQRKPLDDSAMSWSCCGLHYCKFISLAAANGVGEFTLQIWVTVHHGGEVRQAPKAPCPHSQEPRKDWRMDPNSCACFLLGLSWFLTQSRAQPMRWGHQLSCWIFSPHLVISQGHAHRATWSRQLIETSCVILSLVKLTDETAKLRDSQFSPDYDTQSTRVLHFLLSHRTPSPPPLTRVA